MWDQWESSRTGCTLKRCIGVTVSDLEISPKIRAETLSIDQFIKLENYVTQNNINFDC